MANLAATLERQITRIVDSDIKKYEVEVRSIMDQVHDAILSASPVWTGYYKSNHTIVIRSFRGTLKTQGFRLSPLTKDSQVPLFYAANIAPRAAEEKEKLSQFEAGDSITITTGVPYAGEIERDGTETAAPGIYADAAAQFGLKYTAE